MSKDRYNEGFTDGFRAGQRSVTLDLIEAAKAMLNADVTTAAIEEAREQLEAALTRAQRGN